MSLSVLQNKPTLIVDPYPHIVIENALPIELYEKLDREWPEDQLLKTTPYDNGICYRLKADEMLKPNCVSDTWRQFCEYHTSKVFFDEVRQIFGQYIDALEGKLGARGWADKDASVWTDCQTVMHKPINTTSRTAHIDNPMEMYAGLLYMRYNNDHSTGGDFQIHEAKNKINKVDKSKGRQIFEDDLGPVTTTVPYKANTFVMFCNSTPNAIHGVTPRKDATMYRRSVNIIAEYSRQSRKTMYKVTELK